METNLVVESIKFMFLGMGAVFLFLIVMIYSMGMSNFVHKFFPEILVNVNSSAQSTQNVQTNQNIQSNQNDQIDQKKIVAAITAAIQHHIKN